MIWQSRKALAPVAVVITALVIGVSDLSAQLRESTQAQTWDRAMATQALASIDTEPVVDHLHQLTITGADAVLVDSLEAIRLRPDWPEPARDLAIFQYTRTLAALPADRVPPLVMTYLRAYPAMTLVPHEDHPQGWVPLFNVRAAAAGIEHQWLRDEALLEGLALLRSNPRALNDAYTLESAPAVHAGYLQALEQATPEQVTILSSDAASRVRNAPMLTPLAGRAALQAQDLEALKTTARVGEGDAVHRVLMDANSTLSRPARLDLFQATLGSGRRDNAGLAIAVLYPTLAGDPSADEALMARLGDADLGASAALALAQSPALSTRQALEALAATTDRPASRRARTALQLLDEGLLEGTR